MNFQTPTRFAAVFVAALAVSIWAMPAPAEAQPSKPGDATDSWMKDQGKTNADGIADKILKEVGDSGVPSSGKAKDLLKGHIKKKLKEGAKQDVQSEGMDQILAAIAKALKTGKGGPCDRAAINMAYSAVADPSYRRVVKGMGNVWVDVMTDTVTGGAGKAKKLVEMTGSKLTLELAKNLLDKIDKKVKEEIDKAGGGVEVYKSEQSVNGCSVSVAVIWNKVLGTFDYMIAGDCQCKQQFKVLLSKWSVSGSGRAAWKNGKARQPFALTSKAKNRGVIVKSVCCNADGPVNRTSMDPWKPGAVKVPGGDYTPVPTGTTTRPPQKPAEPTAEKKIIQVGGGADVPKGPICPADKEKLLEESSTRLSTIQSNRNKANKDRLAASTGLAAKKSGFTQAKVDAAEAEYRKWVRAERDERNRARAIMQLEEKPSCDKTSSLFVPQSETSGAMVADEPKREREPESQTDNAAWLENLKGMQTSIDDAATTTDVHVPESDDSGSDDGGAGLASELRSNDLLGGITGGGDSDDGDDDHDDGSWDGDDDDSGSDGGLDAIEYDGSTLSVPSGDGYEPGPHD
jgi:hypothetical protein